MTADSKAGGADLSVYAPRVFPGPEPLRGRHVTLEAICDESRFDELWRAYSDDPNGDLWRWMFDGPFQTRAAFFEFASEVYFRGEHRFYAFVPSETGKALGVAALFRPHFTDGVIELGHVCFGPGLQRTLAATEGFFLMMEEALGSLGYRRLEWKCNASNARSKRAAERLGFTYEGLFRQHMIAKGENRDTAWYSVLDREWPALRRAFEAWLVHDNFEENGKQRRSLGSLTNAALIEARR